MTTQTSYDNDVCQSGNNVQFLTKFYAVQRCDSLESPVIFTNWNDCSYYVAANRHKQGEEEEEAKDNDDNDDEDILYKEFDNIIDAVQFILPPSQPLMIPRTTRSTMTTSTPATMTTTRTTTTVTKIRHYHK